MGLLDDAIREHLDLKRRRGADPAEIERAEREALGPVRREPLGSEELGERLDPGVHEPGYAYEEELPSATAPETSADPEPPPLAIGGQPDATATGQVAGEGEYEADYDEYEDDEEFYDEYELESSTQAPPPAAEQSHPPAPAAAPPPPPPRFDDTLGETTEYDIESADAEGPAEDGEDVLEETPEFLQDTPDHDRLWFEQKPPRDFDFDG